MSSLLTAQESEALRAGAGGALPPEPVRLVAHERLVRKSQGATASRLEAFYEAVARRLQLELRRPVAVHGGPGELVGRDALAAAAQGWGAAVALHAGTLGHLGYLALNDALSRSWVEIAYGASLAELSEAAAEPAPARRLTPVEEAVLAPLLGQCAEAFWSTMAGPAPLGPRSHAPVRLPLQLPPAPAAAWQAQMVFKIGQREARIALVVWPHALAPLLEPAPRRGQPTAAAALGRHLLEVSLQISAELGTTQVAVGRLLNMQPGEMLWLDQAQSESLPVCVEGIPKFLARPIQHHGALGVEILARAP